MESSSIEIQTASLADGLILAEAWKLSIGRDFEISPEGVLTIAIEALDDLVLEQSPPPPPPTNTEVMPQRKDIVLSVPAKYEGDIDRARIAYVSDPTPDKKRRFDDMKQAIRDIVARDATLEICKSGGSNLVFGYGETDNAIVLSFPDGGYYNVDRLIHHTHPQSPWEAEQYPNL